MYALLQTLESLIREGNVKETVPELEDVASYQSFSESDQYDHTYHHSKTIRHCSPWHAEFAKVATMADELTNVSIHECNEYYMQGVIDLLQHFLHVFPLWSGVFLGDLQQYSKDGKKKVKEVVPNRATNARVENWFGVCKNAYLRGKRQRLRPGEFIKKYFVNVIGRIREAKWKAPKKKGKTKSRYFSPPVTIPKPKRRKKTHKEDDSNPEEVWRKRGKARKQQKTTTQPKTTKKVPKKCRSEDNITEDVFGKNKTSRKQNPAMTMKPNNSQRMQYLLMHYYVSFIKPSRCKIGGENMIL